MAKRFGAHRTDSAEYMDWDGGGCWDGVVGDTAVSESVPPGCEESQAW